MELYIGCSTLFDMRGNTFADDIASSAAKTWERCSQANAVQAIDGTACQVRMRIVEANLAAVSAQPKREFSQSRASPHSKTRLQKQMSCLKPDPLLDT